MFIKCMLAWVYMPVGLLSSDVNKATHVKATTPKAKAKAMAFKAKAKAAASKAKAGNLWPQAKAKA